MSNSTPAFILANPQMGENIGAAARAILNFGYTDLRIVNPRDGWPNPRAQDTASGALDKMDVQVFDTLKDALADIQCTFATTARTRDMVKPVFTPHAAAQEIHARSGQKVAFVFGAERTGLTNDELALCTHIINIPTNPDFSSLNLGQAVLLIASAAYLEGDQTPARVLDTGDSAPAPQDELENFLSRLENELQDGGFFKAEGLKPTMLRNIRNIFTRAELSAQEVATLQGITSALLGHKKGR